MVNSGSRKPHSKRDDFRRLSRLTPVQDEVLSKIAQGASNAEVAARLLISRRTVEGHVLHILKALQVKNRVQAVILYHDRPITFERD